MEVPLEVLNIETKQMNFHAGCVEYRGFYRFFFMGKNQLPSS